MIRVDTPAFSLLANSAGKDPAGTFWRESPEGRRLAGNRHCDLSLATMTMAHANSAAAVSYHTKHDKGNGKGQHLIPSTTPPHSPRRHGRRNESIRPSHPQIFDRNFDRWNYQVVTYATASADRAAACQVALFWRIPFRGTDSFLPDRVD